LIAFARRVGDNYSKYAISGRSRVPLNLTIPTKYNMSKRAVYRLVVLVWYASFATVSGHLNYPASTPNDEWWSNTIVYQVYPRSFKDSNKDGIGDLKGIFERNAVCLSKTRRPSSDGFLFSFFFGFSFPTGIIQKLDYFVELGVDTLWIGPLFKSPMNDLGYDVEDYRTIDPIFGTMDDFDELIAEMNKRSNVPGRRT